MSGGSDICKLTLTKKKEAAMSVSGKLRALNNGRGLTTAHVLYYLSEGNGAVRRTGLVWKEFDSSPDFPLLRRFVRNWEITVNGRVDTIVVDHPQLNYTGGYRPCTRRSESLARSCSASGSG